MRRLGRASVTQPLLRGMGIGAKERDCRLFCLISVQRPRCWRNGKSAHFYIIIMFPRKECVLQLCTVGFRSPIKLFKMSNVTPKKTVRGRPKLKDPNGFCRVCKRNFRTTFGKTQIRAVPIDRERLRAFPAYVPVQFEEQRI